MIGIQQHPEHYSGGWTPFAGGVSPGSQRPRAPHFPGAVRTELSRRETEIAGLVAEGLTDKQIAEVLVLSPRTVQAHVANALRKTDSRCRTELAIRHVKETLHVDA